MSLLIPVPTKGNTLLENPQACKIDGALQRNKVHTKQFAHFNR